MHRSPLFSFVKQWFLQRKLQQSLGARGERTAAHYLRRHGYTIITGGHRTRYGEIDLIAVDHHRQGRSPWPWLWQKRTDRRTVVFIEVKTRRYLRSGHPAEAVDAGKQSRIAKSALAFLKTHGLLESPARFDVITIIWPVEARQPESLEHFENAFEPPGQGQLYG